MKCFLSLVSVFGLSCLSSTAVAQPCATAANIYHCTLGGHGYDIVRELKSWDSAAACAVRMGGHLAEIGSRAEQDSLYHHIAHLAGISATYTSVADGGGIAYVWLGATDKFAEGSWKWDGRNSGSGTSLWTGQGSAGAGGGSAVGSAFINWGGSSHGAASEPDNYGGIQNAAGIALSAWPYGIAGEWNDIDPANQLYFVVEYDGITEVPVTDHNTWLNIYPDLAAGAFNVNSNATINAITVYDMMGKNCRTIPVDHASSCTVQINDLSLGQYIVRVAFADGSVIVRRIVH